MTIAQFIRQNLQIFDKMVKAGLVPVTYLNYYNVYCVYENCSNLKTKMERYYFTAETVKSNISSVRVAIRAMERIVK